MIIQPILNNENKEIFKEDYDNMNAELKEKVKQYIDQIEGEFYPDDISQTLDADFREVVDICQELISEGIIEIAIGVKKNP